MTHALRTNHRQAVCSTKILKATSRYESLKHMKLLAATHRHCSLQAVIAARLCHWHVASGVTGKPEHHRLDRRCIRLEMCVALVLLRPDFPHPRNNELSMRVWGPQMHTLQGHCKRHLPHACICML